MKTFIKVSLSSAIVTTALFLPIPSFAQSWEPEKSWDDNDSWDASPSTSKPSSQTPSSTNTNTQSNSDDDSWDASPSTPKPAPSTPKKDNDSWDASPSTPKTAPSAPNTDDDIADNRITDSGKADNRITDSGKADNSKTDSGKPDDTKVDNSKADNSKTDSGKPDDTKVDNSKIDDTKVDNSRTDSGKPDNSKTDGNKTSNANRDTSLSTPKPAPSTPKADYDSWDASPSTPKKAPSTPKADYDSWDVSPSTSTSSGAYAQTSNTNSSYTDVALGDSNFVIRVGGGFTYLYYGSIGTANGSKHRAFHYPGANGNLAFNYCMNSHCIGVDQILATVYTYKGSGNHFLGSTHINYINRHLLADSFMLEFGAGAGLTYASNSNYKEKRVFVGNGLAISFKLYCIFTYFITRNIGIGVNVAPLGLIELGLNNPEGSSIKHLPGSVGLDAGLHVMLKY